VIQFVKLVLHHPQDVLIAIQQLSLDTSAERHVFVPMGIMMMVLV
jgi:hypothetical protein